VRDAGAERLLTVPLTNVVFGGEHRQILDGVAPKSLCYFSSLLPGGAAEAGGVHTGDCVRAVNGVPILGALQFLEYMKGNGTNVVHLELVRNGQPLSLALQPRVDPRAGYAIIGVGLGDAFRDVPSWMQFTKPGRQLRADASAVFRLLRALFFPQHAGESRQAANAVRGVPTIVVALWTAIQTGLLNTLGLVRLISVNLAILNLLPIPVLDGGHILFALWELITRRKPHPKVVSVLINFFAVVIIGLMLLLIVRDPHVRNLVPDRWFGHAAPAAAAAATNAAPAAAAAATNAAPGDAAP
jgi:regulator of sigma E protease